MVSVSVEGQAPDAIHELVQQVIPDLLRSAPRRLSGSSFSFVKESSNVIRCALSSLAWLLPGPTWADSCQECG